MSFDKAIEHKKEHRKEYYGPQAVDPTCRPGGDCEWCKSNRFHKIQKRLLEAEEDSKFDDFEDLEGDSLDD